MTGDGDWRSRLLDAAEPLPGTPGLHCAATSFGGQTAVTAAWDFAVHGGSFGEADATGLAAAIDAAIERRLPLVTLVRSGGTRLPEGMRALVGIPRITLALHRLRAARLPLVMVADQPTTGGVWVAVGAAADVRIAVAGAVVGFSGPRVVEAMTGRPLAAGANRAEAAYAAGLVDLLAPAAMVGAAVDHALAVLRPDTPAPVAAPVLAAPAEADGWAQVVRSRTADRPDGATLLTRLLPDGVGLRGADDMVTAAIGRLAGRRVLGVALASRPGAMPGPAGYRLLQRAAVTAGGLDLGLLVLVDTPGADPHTESAGLAPAIAEGMQAVLATPAPTVCLVHGAGGSGGALAGAVTDLVGVGEHGWFAALSPEGAAAALRRTPEEAARMQRLTPADLLADGFADAAVAAGDEPAWVASAFDRLRAIRPDVRLGRRRARWSKPLRRSGDVG